MKKLVALLMLVVLVGCSTSKDKPIEEKKNEVVAKEDIDVSFMAVGDNLIHNSLYFDAKTDNGYDFNPMFVPIKPYVEKADIAYINQETILGGTELELSNYPCFNSPQEAGDALVATGFDWINQATNHSLDRGEAGIVSAMNFWDKYPDIVTTGINRNKEEEQKFRYIKRKDINFGLLSYTYGTNGIEEPEGKAYLVNNIDKDQMKKDVEAIKKTCDVIIVSMHWGNEYQTTPSDEQKDIAQYLSDLGVKVIIGSHPHVIQPANYVTSKSGNKTLVIYSLGNFISAQNDTINMLGGMSTFTIHKDGKTNEYSVVDPKFYPTVTHFEANQTNFKTYVLKDYSDELASKHYLNGLNGTGSITKEILTNKCKEIMGDEIRVVY
ncbi:MAG: CapA family protein [Erysipelotrichaceae bacterium]